MKNHKGLPTIFLLLVIVFSSSSCDLFGQETEVSIEPTAVLTPTTEIKPTIDEHKFSYNGSERIYLLRIPLGLDPTQPAPLVFIFHGMGEKARDMYKAGFNSVADQENIILVYPELVSHTSTDFIKKILLDLSDFVNIDPSRIYAMGFSLGGKLAYHVACEMSDTFAAFAAVSGMAICETSHNSEIAVSIIHIHGLGDDLVPYETGKYGMPPVEETIAYWVQFNKCAISPQVEKTGKIAHTMYSQCRDGAVIELYTIDGLGHKVPAQELPAARIIWEFFEAHPKP